MTLTTEACIAWKPYDAIITLKPVFEKPEYKLAEIKSAVSSFIKVPIIEMESRRRPARIVYARHLFFYLARTYSKHSFPSIARHCGDMDHTSAMHGFRRISGMIKDNHRTRKTIAAIEAALAKSGK